MDIVVDDVGELPAHCYLSVRYGDLRRQVPFRRGQKLTFPGAPEKAYTIDVFKKIGSKQISLAGISALGGTIVSQNIQIPSLEIEGMPMKASFTAAMAQNEASSEPNSFKQQVAKRAKDYLDKHDVQPVMQDMFAQLLERLPSDPLTFMMTFLEQRRQELDDQEITERDFSLEPGMGDEALSGFSDSAAVLPPLHLHHSLVADYLRRDTELYPRLKDVKTSLGVSLSQCIKPGMDCPGHELVKVAGIYAGDAESYDAYKDVFDPVVSALHSGYGPDAKHITDTSPMKITNTQVDETGRYAVFATVETRRNLDGIRLPTCCSFDERREVERAISHALLSFDGELKGAYYPLRSSESYVPKVGGMTVQQEEQMRRACILFTEPDSKMRLSAGLGRNWPDARGIFVNEAQTFHLWCNEEDHIRFFARQHTVDVKAMWARVCKAVSKLEEGVATEGYNFAHSNHLGYITACPSRLGTGLRVCISLKIPLLAASVDLPALCACFQLHSSQEVGSVLYGSVWNISNNDCLGVTENVIVTSVIEGARALVLMEQRLENGDPIYDLIPGMGSAPLFGFPTARCPARLPCLTDRTSLAAQVLRENPSIYDKLRSQKTSSFGISLAPCIKPAMDDRSNKDELFPGLVACDAECFALFSDMFDPVIKKINPGWRGRKQFLNANPLKLSNRCIDPRYIVDVRIEARRNLSGLRLAPCCERAERRQAEQIVVKSLLALTGSWSGDYMPLAWSDSFVAKPGMTLEEQAQLRDDGILFLEPSEPSRLSMGLGREWPDARGIFLSHARDVFAWVNEEDHLCFTMKGNNPKTVYENTIEAMAMLEKEVLNQGSSFMTDERLGYLTVDPVKLGNGLTCIVTLKLPNLGKHVHFSTLCRKLHLVATWRSGAWKFTNLPSLGISEVDLANAVIEGCALLVDLEMKLGSGQAIDSQLKPFVS